MFTSLSTAGFGFIWGGRREQDEEGGEGIPTAQGRINIYMVPGRNLLYVPDLGDGAGGGEGGGWGNT